MWQDLQDTLIDIANWFLLKIVEIIAAFIELFLSIVPDSETFDAQSAVSGWPSDVLYFLGVFEFDYALTALFYAYIARFMLRRIPFIG